MAAVLALAFGTLERRATPRTVAVTGECLTTAPRDNTAITLRVTTLAPTAVGSMRAATVQMSEITEYLKKLPVEMNENRFWSIFGPDCKRLPGFDLLNMPKDFQVTHQSFRGRKEKFWPVIDYVLSGWHDGYLYLRFANGDTPGQHTFTASKGEGFILNTQLQGRSTS